MLHTRLRPHCRDFLEKVSRLYELHVFTFGSRLYAHTIAGERAALRPGAPWAGNTQTGVGLSWRFRKEEGGWASALPRAGPGDGQAAAMSACPPSCGARGSLLHWDPDSQSKWASHALRATWEVGQGTDVWAGRCALADDAACGWFGACPGAVLPRLAAAAHTDGLSVLVDARLCRPGSRGGPVRNGDR